MRTILSTTLLALVLILSDTTCFADYGWQANLLISSGSASSKLTLGQNKEATDGNDGFYDVPALFSGQFHAAFTGGGGTMWRDIRSAGAKTVEKWQLSVFSGIEEAINFSWDKSQFPPSASVTLIDDNNDKSIDMKAISAYSMKHMDSAELSIEVSYF